MVTTGPMRTESIGDGEQFAAQVTNSLLARLPDRRPKAPRRRTLLSFAPNWLLGLLENLFTELQPEIHQVKARRAADRKAWRDMHGAEHPER